jgi:hypothetical protein
MGKWHLGNEVSAARVRGVGPIEDIYSEHFGTGHDAQRRSSYHVFLESQGYKPDNHKDKFSRALL